MAGLNETADDLVLVVDTGDAYRPVPARFLAQIETAGRVVRLTSAGEDAFAASPEVEPRIRGADTPQLVRHIPRQFDRLLTTGRRHASRSQLWYVGGPLLVVGAVGVMAGSALTAEGVGGSMRWLWVVAPLIVLVVGA